MGHKIETYISEQEIKNRVIQLGQQISAEYADQEVTIVAVLNGSFIFCADLLRQIKCPVRIEFIAASSYDGMKRSQNLEIKMDLQKDINNCHVILVEDIVDTGRTSTHLLEMIKEKNPKSLKFCAFLFKPDQMKYKVHIDYIGFEIEDHFVVGYGLDMSGLHRELPYIGIYHAE